MAFWRTNIWVSNYGTRLWARFGLYINCFLYHLFIASWFLVLLLYFDFDRRFVIFLEILDHSQLIQYLENIKLYKNRLELLKM